MLQKEDELLQTMDLLLARSPALVNARHPTSGASLLHFVVYKTNSTKLLRVSSAEARTHRLPP